MKEEIDKIAKIIVCKMDIKNVIGINCYNTVTSNSYSVVSLKHFPDKLNINKVNVNKIGGR